MKRTASVVHGMVTILLLIFLCEKSMAGVVIEQMMKGREGIASKVIIYYSGHRFRTDHLEGGLTTIMDFKGDRMIMVDHSSRSYVEVKFSHWEKEIAKRLKKETPVTTPRERKIIVRRAGETATINGFRTEKIEILADGELIEENWVTRDVDLKEMEEVMEKEARGFSKEFRLEMKEGREIYEKLKPYGFPILIKDYTMTYGLGPIDRMEVKRIEQKDLKDEVFLPPAGYQRIVPKPSKK
ncbi:MAG: DUF4412 domain-containing protein [Thermodesulfobacteriota bacterium]